MARIFDLSVYAVAVLDATDVALQAAAPDDLLLVDVSTRDGKVIRELMDKCTARTHWRAFRRAIKGLASVDANATALFGGCAVPCRDVTDIGVLGPRAMVKLGNGGFSFYAPARRTIWSAWGALVRGLCRDLTLDGKAPLRATEFALIIGDGLDQRTVAQWLAHSRMSSRASAEHFTRLRACIDAMLANWVLSDRHPSIWQFVRGTLPGTKTPVLDLLKTEAGAAEVTAYIVTTADPAFLRKRVAR